MSHRIDGLEPEKQPPIKSPSAAAERNAPASQGDGWRAFDRIYCISLVEREDRRSRAQSRFQGVGLDGQVEFKLVDRHPLDSEQGIYESHMACLRDGLAHGAGRILVFEDDILFKRLASRTLEHAANFVRDSDEWDVLFLGCFVRSSATTDHPSILRIRYQCCAHAYVMNRPFAEQFVQTPWRGVPYDDALRAFAGTRFFAVYPGIAYQDDSSSDNWKTPGIDRTRRFLGGLHRLQRWNEWSHRHMTALVLSHAAAIALIILAVMLARK